MLAVTQLRALQVTVGCVDVWMCGSREGSPLTDISTSIGVQAEVLAGAVHVRCAYNNETQSFKGCDR